MLCSTTGDRGCQWGSDIAPAHLWHKRWCARQSRRPPGPCFAWEGVFSTGARTRNHWHPTDMQTICEFRDHDLLTNAQRVLQLALAPAPDEVMPVARSFIMFLLHPSRPARQRPARRLQP